MTELPWQHNQWQRLQTAYAQQHLPHAVLLRGPAHTGKQAFAIAIARWLLCQTPGVTAACGQCKACHLLQAGTHPDLLMVQPEEPGKAIKVEQIRELVAFCANSAQFDGYKVVVISPAEGLNNNAANALLKSLEEPGQRTLMLLVSHQSGGLMATLTSRCQALEFPMPSESDVTQWLLPTVNDPTAVAQLIAASNGAPLLAKQFYENDGLTLRAQTQKHWLGLITQELDPVSVAAQWSDIDLPLLLDWLMSWQVDYLRFLAGGEPRVRNQDLLPSYRIIQPHVTPETCQQHYLHLQHLAGLLKRKANPNHTLLLEDLCIRLARFTG